eukprot:jgi/Bigna1/81594/fgenesh1_pg.82_\
MASEPGLTSFSLRPGKVVRNRSDGSIALQFLPDERICFHGEAFLRVVAGEFEVMQHILRPTQSKYEVSCPNWNPGALLTIKPLQEAKLHGAFQQLPTIKIIPLNTTAASKKRRRSILSNNSTSSSSPPPSLQKAKRIDLGMHEGKMRRNLEIIPGFFIVCRQTDKNKFMPMTIPRDWTQTMENILKESTKMSPSPSSSSSSSSSSPTSMVTMVAGYRNTGKSSFCRLLVNTLLNTHRRVAFLGTDLGQSEMSPPGISDRHPRSYLKAVSNAMKEYFRLRHPRPPLVINTQGWIKGLGLAQLQGIIAITKPRYIVCLGASKEQPKYQIELVRPSSSSSSSFSTIHISMRPERVGRARATASDLRHFSLVRYFAGPSSTFLTAAHSLAAQPPYLVAFSKVWVGTCAADHEGTVSPRHILRCLNASIVGLAQLSDENMPQKCVLPEQQKDLEDINIRGGGGGGGGGGDQKNITSVSQPANPPHHHHLKILHSSRLEGCRVLGLGIIRGIDVVAKTFYVLTPIPSSKLGSINAFVKSELQLPTVMTSLHDPTSTPKHSEIPYVTDKSIQGFSVMNSRSSVKRNRG